MGDFQEIDHEGVIKSIDGNIATVTILQKTSCASCELTGACSGSESSVKEVEVPIKNRSYEKGEFVNIVFTRSEGFIALFIGYLLPFILMIMGMAVSSIFTDNDLIKGLVALGLLPIYYTILFLMKNNIRALFEFRFDNDK
ncbi:MAG: SoxR reducing system RseC family protein [Ichthyobacteriaceae bacterium]|nr:SoxR reducing system RseC family protein [Ichthyobacteriaceae bacterium]